MSQPADSRGRQGKVMNDPIHGHIYLSARLLAVVDTPHFQRLRELKQLGSTYFIFPGASHNRFEHSIGVSHLAGKLVRNLQSKQPELGIDDRDVFLVELAGLVHDLGHASFSHSFEKIINNLNPDANFHHETMSQAIFRDMVDEYDLLPVLDMTEDDLLSVIQLIKGESDEAAKREKPFLYDIVANARNGIDVDKLDYLARDAYNVGIKSTFDFERLFSFCKVIDGEICFYVKEAFNLYQMFHTRYSLHKQVYTHKTSCGIDYMIQDIIEAAYDFLGISKAIAPGGVKHYLRLTDSILRTIENTTPEDHARFPSLKDAYETLMRLRTRDLYPCIDETVLPKHAGRALMDSPPTVDDIMAHHTIDWIALNPDDLIVDMFKLNYSKKDENPVDFVHFYTHFASTDKISIAADKVSQLIPSQFQEVGVRVFLRTRATDAIYAARLAFKSWCRSMKATSPFPSHPLLPNSPASPSSFPVSAPARLSTLLDGSDDDASLPPSSPQNFGSTTSSSLKRRPSTDDDAASSSTGAAPSSTTSSSSAIHRPSFKRQKTL